MNKYELGEKEINSYRQNYDMMDLMKFIMSIMIVALHTEVFTELGAFSWWAEKAIFRIAVPFFFCSSGFLLSQKIHQNDVKNASGVVFRHNRKLLKMLIVFEPISLLLNILLFILKQKDISYILLKSIQSIIFYPYGSLWYIQASIIGSFGIIMFYKSKRKYLYFLICVLFYFWTMLCNSYYFLAQALRIDSAVKGYLLIFYTARNGVFYGFGMLLLGCFTYFLYTLLKNNSRREKKIILLLVCLLIIYLFYVYELWILSPKKMIDDGSTFIFHVPLTLIIVLLCALSKNHISHAKAYRNMSTWIFLTHRPITYIVLIIEKIMNITIPNGIEFILVLILSTIISIIIIKIKKNKTVFG